MIPRSITPNSPMVREAAEAAGLPAPLVAAIVHVESGGECWAFNPEPHYRYLWDVRNNTPFRRLSSSEARSEAPPEDFPRPRGVPRDAEWWAQQASYGVLQVMGAVAREYGFTGKWLSELHNPYVCLEIGCKYLSSLVARYGGRHLDAVAAYNAGSARRRDDGKYVNQGYVDKVVAAAGRYGYWIGKLANDPV